MRAMQRCAAPQQPDDRRRTFPQPRQGLKPCVAPYFADLGVGDMRGPPRRTPHDATPEVVAGRQTPNIDD